jgi:homoaconitase/3-isopropylmalate dehydratase large subunit
LLDHPLALRREIGSRRDLLAAAGRSDRSKKQILCDDSHSSKDKAACAAAKGAGVVDLRRLSYRIAAAFM